MQASAFTLGSDIFFGDRTPSMSARAGQQLLAHKLAHTVQQGATVQHWNPFKRKGKKEEEKPFSTREGRGQRHESKESKLSLAEYCSVPARAALFVDWVQANGSSDEKKYVSLEAITLNKASLAPASLGAVEPPYDRSSSWFVRCARQPTPASGIASRRPSGVRQVGRRGVARGELLGGAGLQQGGGGLNRSVVSAARSTTPGISSWAMFGPTPLYDEGLKLKGAPQGSAKVPPPVPPRANKPPPKSPDQPQGGGNVKNLANQIGGQIKFGPPAAGPKRANGSPPRPATGRQGGRGAEAAEEPDPPLRTPGPARDRAEGVGEAQQGRARAAGPARPPGRQDGEGSVPLRGRKVTDTTEGEYQEILGKLDKDEAKILKTAIDNYTRDSARVNDYGRGMTDKNDTLAMSTGKKLNDEIDQMFDVFESKGFTDKTRVTYRLQTYKPGQEPPYPDKIKLGDFLMDKAFVSASENRQLLVQGVQNPAPGTRYVKYTIVGAGATNISGGSQYTDSERAGLPQHELAQGLRGHEDEEEGPGPCRRAGRGLVPSQQLLHVDSIRAEGGDFHVMITKVEPKDAKGNMKNPFNGAAQKLLAVRDSATQSGDDRLGLRFALGEHHGVAGLAVGVGLHHRGQLGVGIEDAGEGERAGLEVGVG